MKVVLSVRTMRESDAAAIAAGTPGRKLMARAAAGIAEAGHFTAPVAVLCGSGNNGGDGYAAALLLAEKGLTPELIRVGDRLSEDGRYFLEECLRRNIPCRFFEEGMSLKGCGSVLDCLFGTGFRGKAEGLAAEAIKAVNGSGAYVISADIPSGINGDSGLGEPAVKAHQTVSVGSLKSGHFLGRALDMRGELVNCDIGIVPLRTDALLLEEEDAAACLPRRAHYAHKGLYGYTALAGGSLRYSGAPRLAAMAAAAMRSGAGVVMAAVPRSLAPLMAPLVLESTLFPLSETEDGGIRFVKNEWEELTARVKTLAFGMGAGRGKETEKTLVWLLENYRGRLILDADALTALADAGTGCLRNTQAEVLLTPHLGEASRLMGIPAADIEADPVSLAKAFAAEYRCSVLLKGPSTLVTDGTVCYLTERGCPGMATAGSGDVLSGTLAAILAYSPAPLPLAAAVAAYICGMAGEMAEAETGPAAMLSGDTAVHIGEAVHRLETVRDQAAEDGSHVAQ